MSDKNFKPFVSPDVDMKELSFKALLLGVIMAIILGAANAYLGLRAGMTVAATFPAAVIAMAVLRPFKGTILEENLARTTGAVGEALAAGAVFTIPAFLMSGVWKSFDLLRSSFLMLIGGVLGVLFVIVLRKTLVEDVSLPFPESKACAEIVKAGQGGSTGAGYVFYSMLLAGIINFFENPKGLMVIKDKATLIFNLGLSKLKLIMSSSVQTIDKKGLIVASTPNPAPAFLGVGYIIGFRLAAITFSGGVFGWLFLMPVVLFLMSGDLSQFMTGSGSIASVASAAYSATVKPIAVGGMLVGAFYTLFKMRNSLVSGIKKGLEDIKKSKEEAKSKTLRTDKDAPFGIVFLAILVLVIAMVAIYKSFTGGFGSAILAAIIMAIAGFVFAAVAGYLVGIIGSSSNPISGLTLSTLLIAALLMVAIGMKGNPGVAAVLGVATVVCCIAGVAGDMMQDWKVGHILGGTPWRMQIGGMIGVIAAGVTLIFSLKYLNEAYHLGSSQLPAPQAGLMAMMSKGIVGGEMSWILVIAGMLFAVALILIESPSPMLIAVGMYLPFETTAAIFVGGLFKWIVERIVKNKSEEEKVKVENTGLLIASGLVAGEALMGIICAILFAAGVNIAQKFNLVGFEGYMSLNLLIFIIIGFILIYFPVKSIKKVES